MHTRLGALVVVALALGCGTTETPPPDRGTCVPITCASANRSCGQIDDGCGNTLECGQCAQGQHCASGACEALPASCVAATCAEQNATCGWINDNCGGMIACGGCADGESCNAQHQCEGTSPNCQPKTCADYGANCGAVSDGCGHMLNCGTCGQGQQCNVNHCENVPPNCQPKTCAQLGATCGSVSDGCGNTLSCGTCGAGQSCNANRCETPTSQGGSLGWLQTRDTFFWSANADATGALFAVRWPKDTNSAGAELERFTPEGQSVGTISTVHEDFFFGGMPHPTADSVYYFGEVGYPNSPPNHQVRRYTKSGVRGDLIQVGGDVSYFEVAAVSKVGSVAILKHVTSLRYLLVVHSDNSAFELSDQDKPLTFTGAAFDDADNVLFSATVKGAFTWDGHTFGIEGRQLPGVFKLNRNGQLIWGRAIDANGEAVKVGVTSIGTAVLLAYHQTPFTFAGATTAQAQGLTLAIYEADGTERLATPVGNANNHALLAVDPIGRAFVAYSPPDCSNFSVAKFNLAGAREWARSFPSGISFCNTNLDNRVFTLTISGHAPVLAGSFNRPYDFGNGVKTPTDQDGFLFKLNP